MPEHPTHRVDVGTAYLSRCRGGTVHARLLDGHILTGTLLGYGPYDLLMDVPTLGAVLLCKHAVSYLLAPGSGSALPTPAADGGDEPGDWLGSRVGQRLRVELCSGRAVVGELIEVGRHDLLLCVQGRHVLVRKAAVACVSVAPTAPATAPTAIPALPSGSRPTSEKCA